MADRSCLARQTATSYVCVHIETIGKSGSLKRLLDDHFQSFTLEVFLHLYFVDDALAGAGSKSYSGYSILSSANGIKVLHTLLFSLQAEFYRLLSFMWMLASGIDFQFFHHCATECILRHHTFDGMLDNTLRMLFQYFGIRDLF